MSFIWVIALSLGATARITRAVNADTILQPFRDWVDRTWPGIPITIDTPDGPLPLLDEDGQPKRLPSKPSKLVSCPWCLGFWFSFAATGTAFVINELGWWQWWAIPYAALTISYAVGVLAEWEEPPHQHAPTVVVNNQGDPNA